MKFYNLDLTKLTPYGVPINDSNHVESINYINKFFLDGFTNWFSRLYTVDDFGDLQTDYSRSCTAPNSLAACNYSSDAQLQKSITEAGFKYYATNDHDINAKFLYDLYRVPFGTEDYLTAIAQYVSNSSSVYAETMYANHEPYTYGIRLYGDITDSLNVVTITSRMIDHLAILGTAHTKVTDFEIEDTESIVSGFAGCIADDLSYTFETTLSQPESDADLIAMFSVGSPYIHELNMESPELHGTIVHPESKITPPILPHMISAPIFFRTRLAGQTPRPLLGYSSMKIKHGDREYNYIVNDRGLPSQYLNNGTNKGWLFIMPPWEADEKHFSNLTLESFYSNRGIRKQVFSFRTHGYKRYIDAEAFYSGGTQKILAEDDLEANDIYKEQHFFAYLQASGLSIPFNTTFRGLYYGQGSNTYLIDDAFGRKIVAVYGCNDETYKPDLGDINDPLVFKYEVDGDGEPFNPDSFVEGTTESHGLYFKNTAGTYSKAVFVEFKLIPRPEYLEGWSHFKGQPSAITTTSKARFTKQGVTSGSQPSGTGDKTDYGSNFSLLSMYAPSTTLAVCNFMNVTEAQAWLGTSDQTWTFKYYGTGLQAAYNANEHVQEITSTNEGHIIPGFFVAKFGTITNARVPLMWTVKDSPSKEIRLRRDELFAGMNGLAPEALEYEFTALEGTNNSPWTFDEICKFLQLEIRVLNPFNSQSTYQYRVNWIGPEILDSYGNLKITWAKIRPKFVNK